ELDDEATALGARLHYIRYSRRDLLSFATGFRHLLTKRRYHAVHDHQDYSAGLHFLLGLGRLPPVRIAHVHNPAYRLVEHRTDRLSRLAGIVGKLSLRGTRATVAGTSRQLLHEYGFRVDASDELAPRAIYCGFDVARYCGDRERAHATLTREFGWRSADPVVLFVGRLGGDEIAAGGRSHKNPLFALDVFREAKLRCNDLRMLYVGEKGEMHTVLADIVRDNGLGDSVSFAGLRSDVPQLMLGANALLFPSSAEGLGMVAVEAQAAGLPVLASDTTPRECVVVSDLIEFVGLDQGTGHWADRLLVMIHPPATKHAASNAAVADSPFSISTSALELLRTYSRGLQTDKSAGLPDRPLIRRRTN
ncbi:MAG TPA: glycosyltransferase, partial [Gemmatimonadaceae bacterium]|nr:glycosyltransferase [Gemmatimonadaceae bacterium]